MFKAKKVIKGRSAFFILLLLLAVGMYMIKLREKKIPYNSVEVNAQTPPTGKFYICGL